MAYVGTAPFCEVAYVTLRPGSCLSCNGGINSRDLRHVRLPGWLATLAIMNIEKKDEDPTSEEEALEYDGTKTDQLDDSYRVRIVSASENGRVDHDERGQARWKWSTEEGSVKPSDTGTFNMLKALDNEALSLAERGQPLGPIAIDKIDGYNPSDTVIEAEPPKGFARKQRNVKPPSK